MNRVDESEGTPVASAVRQTVAARFALALTLGFSASLLRAWAPAWELGRPVLESLPSTTPNVAVGLALLSIGGLFGTTASSRKGALRLLPAALATTVLVMGLATLAVAAFGWPLRIDTAVDPAAGRMAAGTAIALLLLAAAVIAGERPRPRLELCLVAFAILAGIAGATSVAAGSKVGVVRTELVPPPIADALLLALTATGLILASRARRATEGEGAARALAAEILRARPTIVRAALALLVGLVATTVVVVDARRTLHAAAAARFTNLANRVVAASHRRVTLVEYGLKGARGVYAANGGAVGRRAFGAYVASRDLEREFPGALGMGFIARVQREQLGAFVDAARADGAPDLTIHDVAGRAVPAQAPEAYVIEHVFPEGPNRAALGLDIGSEHERRAAAELARESGELAVTGQIHLVQDDGHRTGLLFLIPVYAEGRVPGTPEGRRDSCIGFTYAAMILDHALDTISSSAVDGDVDFAVFDGPVTQESTLLFGHGEGWGEAQVPHRAFTEVISKRMGGRTWTYVTRSSPKFEATIVRSTPAILGSCGVLLSILLALSVWAGQVSHLRSLALATAQAGEAAARAGARQAERLAEIARRTSDAVIITDASGRIEWVNEGFHRLSGYTLDEAVGRRTRDFLRGPKTDHASAGRIDDLVADGGARTAELLSYAKDGREYLVSIEVVPLRGESGLDTGFMAIASDVTEQRRTMDALRAAQARAEAASRSKSEFLANMSHEIRTPLTAILGFADLLRDEASAGQRLEIVDTIKSAGAHLLTVINDILDLSKIEADRMTVERVETPLGTILHEVDSLLRSRAIGKGLGLDTILATPVPARIMSDPTRLRQILMNLVGNAVKFTEAGHVSVVTSLRDRDGRPWLRIDVEDSGPGMSPEQAGCLFTAFGQADTTVTRKHGGTGLGLTICRRLAGLMGGAVSLARTAPGKGSTFRVDLPLELAVGSPMITRLDAVEHRAKEATAATALHGRILLAEDGADNQRLISYHLKKAGASVEVAEDGLVALRRIEQAEAAGTPYDLLLTDMQMPEMDGYTLARTLRARGSTLAIVALTAHAMAEDEAKCHEAGCDDYAVKPIDRARLLATCAAWLGRKGGARTVASAAA